MSDTPIDPAISIVIPLYNEQDNVEPLCALLVEALPDDRAWEVIFVDDGSRDATFERLADSCAREPRFRAIRFRRNYGQTPAMVAGIEHARGSVILTMDGDLQNDPSDIPQFLEAIEAGYDVVVGWRVLRQDALWSRKIPSRIANWIIGRVTGVPIRDNGCSLKAYRSQLIKNVQLYSEMHRFIPAMTFMAGGRILEIPVKHHPRLHGASKYGLKRAYKVILDLVVIRMLLSTARSPIRYFSAIALPLALLGTGMIGYSLLKSIGGELDLMILSVGLLWSTLAASSLFWGFIGELVHRTSERSLAALPRLIIDAPAAGMSPS
jgi:glycosyltransferase involved in cell wall biosynthesis